MFWRARAGRYQHRLHAIKPTGVQFGRVIDQIPWRSSVSCAVDESVAVARILRSDDEHQIRLRCQDADCLLSIRRGVTDVILGRGFDVWIPLSQGVDDALSIGHAQCGLGDECELVGSREFDRLNFFGGFDDGD